MGAYLIYFVMFTSNLMHSVVWNQSLHFLNSLVISLILLVYIFLPTIFPSHTLWPPPQYHFIPHPPPHIPPTTTPHLYSIYYFYDLSNNLSIAFPFLLNHFSYQVPDFFSITTYLPILLPQCLLLQDIVLNLHPWCHTCTCSPKPPHHIH